MRIFQNGIVTFSEFCASIDITWPKNLISYSLKKDIAYSKVKNRKMEYC